MRRGLVVLIRLWNEVSFDFSMLRARGGWGEVEGHSRFAALTDAVEGGSFFHCSLSYTRSLNIDNISVFP